MEVPPQLCSEVHFQEILDSCIAGRDDRGFNERVVDEQGQARVLESRVYADVDAIAFLDARVHEDPEHAIEVLDVFFRKRILRVIIRQDHHVIW